MARSSPTATALETPVASKRGEAAARRGIGAEWAEANRSVAAGDPRQRAEPATRSPGKGQRRPPAKRPIHEAQRIEPAAGACRQRLSVMPHLADVLASYLERSGEATRCFLAVPTG